MKKKGIVINALVLTLAGLITRFLGISYKVYLSNTIGAEGIGLYQLVMPIYMFAVTLSTSGISIAVSILTAQESAKNQDGNVRRILRTATFFTAFLSIVVGLLLYKYAAFIGTTILRDDRTILAICCLAPSLFFVAVSSCIKGYFFGLQEVVKPASSQILEQLIRIAAINYIVVLWLPKGLSFACAAAVAGITIGEVISCIYVYILYKLSRSRNRCIKPSTTYMASLSSILGISIPIMASRVLSSILKITSNILIPIQLQLFGLTHKNAMITFGMLKGMVMPLLFFPTALLTSLAVTLVPRVSEANAINNKRRLSYTVSKALHYTSLLGIGMACIFITFSYDLGIAVYHKKEVGEMLQVLSFVCPFMYLQLIVVGILNGLGQQMTTFRNSIIDMLITLLFIYIFIPRYGFGAYLIGIAASAFITSLLNLSKLLKITTLAFDFFNWLIKPSMAALAAGVYSFLISRHYLLPISPIWASTTMGIFILCIIYLVLLFILRCISFRDILWLWHSLVSQKKVRRMPANKEI